MQCLSDTCGKWLSPLNASGCSMPNHRLCESIQGTLKTRNKEGNGSMDYDGKQGANDGSSPKVVTGSPSPPTNYTNAPRLQNKTSEAMDDGSPLMCAAHKRIERERDTNSPRFCLHGQKKLSRPSLSPTPPFLRTRICGGGGAIPEKSSIGSWNDRLLSPPLERMDGRTWRSVGRDGT